MPLALKISALPKITGSRAHSSCDLPHEDPEPLTFKMQRCWDVPGSPVVKSLPSNAGDTGSIPGQGTKIPHAVGQQSPRATTTELARLN